jgi:uncharacterized membrane protein YphA (DoxX/SURF4 family)
MWLTFATAASIGLLLGLRFRVSALVAASMMTFALCLLIAPFAGLSPLSTAGMILALLSTLQVGYLVGLLISVRGRGRALSGATREARAASVLCSR